MTKKRRREILDILSKRDEPITGTDLAKIFDVSRQVIVQDIAVLRAEGSNILATSKGYYIPKIRENSRIIETIVCNHQGYESLEKELTIMIDMGAKILDVIVMHPVYGEIRCPLMINSRYDLENFIESVKDVKASPLASLTDGEHIHTIEVPSTRVFNIIKNKLKEEGILADN